MAATGRPVARRPIRPSREPEARSPTSRPRTSRIGSQTMRNQIRPLGQRLEDRDQAGGRLVDDGAGFPALGRGRRGHDRDAERGGQRGVAGAIVEVLQLGRQLLDLAADVGQPGLDLEDVADLGGLARRCPGGRLSLACRFLIRAWRSMTWPVTSTASVCSVTTLVVRPLRPRSRSEGVFPAVGRDPVGDLGGRAGRRRCWCWRRRRSRPERRSRRARGRSAWARRSPRARSSRSG